MIVNPKTLDREEAILRIAQDFKVTTMFQGLPDVTGINYKNEYDRSDLIDMLRQSPLPIYESGPVAQRLGYGIYVVTTHRKLGRGQLFIQTVSKNQHDQKETD